MEILNVSLGLIIKDNKILLTKESGEGHWKIPGGRKEEGESAEETLIRELEEEINIRMDKNILKSFGEYKYQNKRGKKYLINVFEITKELTEEPKASNEIEKIDWFPIDFLSTNKVNPAVNIIYKDLVKSKNL